MVTVNTENETRTRDVSITLTPAEVMDALIAYAVANGDADNQLPSDFAMDGDDEFLLSFRAMPNSTPQTIFNNGSGPDHSVTLSVTETD